MHSDQDILDYLTTYSEDAEMSGSLQSGAIKARIDSIEDCRKLPPPSAKKLTELNAARLIASNTLKNSKEVEFWNLAQRTLFDLIVRKAHLDSGDLLALNSSLTNGPSVVRDFEIGTGAGTYLSCQFVVPALDSHLARLEIFNGHPLRQAFETYLNLVTVHPFQNGNGRTARLAADFYLFKNGFLPVCFESPVRSHVALIKNGVLRLKDEAYLRFLQAVENSYHLVY